LRRLFDTEERPAFRRDLARGKPRGANTRGANTWQSRARSGRDRAGANRGRPMPVVGAVSGEPYVVASPQLAASPILRGYRAAIPHREALMLQAVINHPWLLHDHLDALAEVEFRHPDASKLKIALVDIGAQDGAPDTEAMRAELGRRGFADLVGRIERSITIPAVWGARPDTAPADVVMTWTQLIALHRQWHSLIKELKDADQALGH